VETLWGTGTGTGEAFGLWSGGGIDLRSRSSVRSLSLPTATLVVVMEAGRSRL
jgi:hypothetical protein